MSWNSEQLLWGHLECHCYHSWLLGPSQAPLRTCTCTGLMWYICTSQSTESWVLCRVSPMLLSVSNLCWSMFSLERAPLSWLLFTPTLSSLALRRYGTNQPVHSIGVNKDWAPRALLCCSGASFYHWSWQTGHRNCLFGKWKHAISTHN